MNPREQRTSTAIKRLYGIEHPIMAEIGTGHCNMMKELLRQHPTLHLHIVDNWLPADQQPQAYIDTGDDFAKRDEELCEAHYQQAVAVAKSYRGRVTIHRADSVEAARDIEDGALDLVFIDADHSYEGCKRDIAAWLPKVRRGGWLGGHDYYNHEEKQFDFTGVDRAVDELSRNFGIEIEEDLNFTWWVRR